MRLILELLLVAALVAFAWEKPYSERASELPILGAFIASPPAKVPATAAAARAARPPVRAAAPVAVPVATPDNRWMWDPNRRGSLDRPSPHAAPSH